MTFEEAIHKLGTVVELLQTSFFSGDLVQGNDDMKKNISQAPRCGVAIAQNSLLLAARRQ